jgi:predicted RNA methylase
MKILQHLIIISALLVLLFANPYAQVLFNTHIITSNAAGAWSVYAVDVDGDDDIDVLSASKDDDKIAWYENDGSQNFAAHTITTDADGAVYVYAIDMDDDGDIDVVSTAYGEDSSFIGEIAWYENDGSENFTTHYIVTNALWPGSGYAMDLDNDNDIDVLFCELLGKRFSWCENDGSQNFTTHIIDTSTLMMYTCVYAADVDGDSDMDVLTTSVNDDLFIFDIAWYENDGNQNFTAHTITTTALGASSVYATDLDGDTDIDVLSTSNFDHKVAWYENDGSQNFTTHTITTAANAAWDVYTADVDGDTDIDILSASAGDNKINWYENDGSQNFTTHTIATDALHASQVYAVDMDGDVDIDVLAPSRYSNRVYWYENLIATGIEYAGNISSIPDQLALYQNFPNPFNPSTKIEYSVPQNTHVEIVIYNVIGQVIKTLVNENINAGIHSVFWDGRNNSGDLVNSGLYFYQIISEDNSKSRKMLLLK